MIVGLGIDVVEIGRIRDLHRRRGDRFCRRVFTPGEVAACLGRADPAPALAARFAAKEAGMKALGTGWGEGVGWHDLEVVSAAGRAPRLQLHGGAAVRAAALGAQAFHLSLSHDGGVSAAVVVLEAAAGGTP
ncbi:MAG TPA: holo-ACP synthase [Deferrisomatales bacterium]|nr:holo-ACP synthase [Deferrisomatales bacterium]